jgi:hypothetical protein
MPIFDFNSGYQNRKQRLAEWAYPRFALRLRFRRSRRLLRRASPDGAGIIGGTDALA